MADKRPDWTEFDRVFNEAIRANRESERQMRRVAVVFLALAGLSVAAAMIRALT